MKTKNEYKQTSPSKNILLIAGLSVALGLAGCQQEGTAEKAGKNLDRSIENAEQKIEGTKEKVEKKLDDVKKSIGEKTETGDQYVDDSLITMHVKKAILDDPLLNVFQIKVTTVNGIVQLSGILDSKEIVDRAIEVVTNQEHVRSVKNELTLKADVSSEK